jgi:tRNA(Ile)-lysidine synthase
MPGPHPAVAAVRRAVRPYVADGPLVVACSGGADSLALAAAVAFEAAHTGAPVALATVDHGLQDGSADQARRVAALGWELGYDPVEVLRVEVGSSGGVEAAARTARYAALDAMTAALGGCLLLGHTLDDQAETVLLGLGRGSGPGSIAGMRPRSGRHLRPLLGLRRRDTEAACRALGLDFWDDPHNADPVLQRVRLRREVLPLLEDVLQGGVAEALARTATQLQDLLEALADPGGFAVHGAGKSPGSPLEVAELAELPRAVRTRLLHAWALAGGASEVPSHAVDRLDALITDWHGQRRIDLPGGVGVVRRSGKLVLEAATPMAETPDPGS